MAWVARQVFRDPLRLFDANMFHPHGGALAYTEPLIVPGLLAAPVRWFGGSALLAHNLLVLLGFTFTALATYALVRTWTGDRRAGLLSGALFAFSTVLLTRVAHVQALHAYWLPLALLALHRLLTRRRTRDAAGLGLCVIGAALTSGYLVVFVCFALGAAALARAGEFRGRDGVRLLLRLAGAAAASLALLLVVLRPHVEARHQRPPVAETTEVTTALGSFLSSAARLHYASWSGDWYHAAPGALFPGLVALALAGAALLRRRSAAPRGTRRMLVAVAGVGCVMALGALTPVYAWAYDLAPPLQGLRAVHRFGILVTLALAALAGVGFSGLTQAAGARRRTLALIALLALATAESFHGVGSYPRLHWAGRVHRYLAAFPQSGAVLELPIFQRHEFHRNARYLLASTVHWRPLVNGFGGFTPPGFDAAARLAGAFPSPPTVAWLQEIGVGHVVVHTDRYSDPDRFRQVLDRIDGRRRDFALEAADGATRLYRILGAQSQAVAALTPAPVFSDLRFVDGPADDSVLRSAAGASRAFGFQSRERFIAYLEPTAPAAHVLLRLPAAMSGRFLDAATGTALEEVAVPAGKAPKPPTPVYAPAGRAAVLLDLQAAP